ncbi:MAG: MFS transporter [Chloroflexota bacterium]|nr:MFS transporter [Chloroflexota bacterium]MDE2885671.1 MFS transporter [Chloroflexota bacterium]
MNANPSLSSRIGRLLDVFSTLRYRNMRLFWSGLLAQVAGQQMMTVTIGWLAFELTESPLALGIINLLLAAPRIVLNLVGGALADRWDQRTLIVIGQSLAMVVLLALATLTLTGNVEVWHLGAGALLIGFFHALEEPSRASLFPHLLPRRDLLPTAVPLISMAWQLSRLTAPAIAGFVIHAAGAGTSFFISAAGGALMITMIRLLQVGRIPRDQRGSILQSISEGMKYAWGYDVFRIVIGMAFFNSLLAMGYILMLPVFAADVFQVDSRGLGLLYSFGGVGGIVALLTVSKMVRRLGPGKVILGGIIVLNSALIAFALSPSFELALAFMTLVGFAGHVYLTGGEVLLQMLVPDELRGRVMGLYQSLWSIMPLGAALLNSIAEFAGAPLALAGGSATVLLFALVIGLPNKALRSSSVETPAEPERAGQA